MRNPRRKNRLFRRLGLAFAVALVAVPVAQARPDEGANISKAQNGPLVQAFDKAGLGQPTTQPQSWPAVDPRTYGSKVVPSEVLPEPQSWPGVTAPAAAPLQVVEPDGFNWGDSGIGAGTAFAVILLAAVALLAVRHVGHGHQATA
jgi:hypothetical protein